MLGTILPHLLSRPTHSCSGRHIEGGRRKYRAATTAAPHSGQQLSWPSDEQPHHTTRACRCGGGVLCPRPRIQNAPPAESFLQMSVPVMAELVARVAAVLSYMNPPLVAQPPPTLGSTPPAQVPPVELLAPTQEGRQPFLCRLPLRLHGLQHFPPPACPRRSIGPPSGTNPQVTCPDLRAQIFILGAQRP